jgi:antagonist of KipI
MAQARFLGERFVIDARSDRMGLRLIAASGGLLKEAVDEIVSEGVATGAVQVPPDGQPIILLADHQTVGGYPKIAVAASIDLPLLAQLRAGDTVAFAEISVPEAQDLWLANERLLATVKQGIALHAT